MRLLVDGSLEWLDAKRHVLRHHKFLPVCRPAGKGSLHCAFASQPAVASPQQPREEQHAAEETQARQVEQASEDVPVQDGGRLQQVQQSGSAGSLAAAGDEAAGDDAAAAAAAELSDLAAARQQQEVG